MKPFALGLKSMKRLFAKSQHQIISQCAALFLCFWMSGAICAVVCCATETSFLAAELQATNGSGVQENISCPMHKQAATQSPERNSSVISNSFASSPSPNALISKCCNLASYFITARQTTDQTDVSFFVVAARHRFDFAATFKSRRALPQTNYQIAPQSRGDTYLENCVFLI